MCNENKDNSQLCRMMIRIWTDILGYGSIHVEMNKWKSHLNDYFEGKHPIFFHIYSEWIDMCKNENLMQMTIFKPSVHDTVYSVNKQHLHRFLWGVCRSWAGCCCEAPGTWRWLTCSLGTGFLSVTGQIQSHPSAHLDRCQLPPTSHHRWHWRWTWNRMTTVLSFLCLRFQ